MWSYIDVNVRVKSYFVLRYYTMNRIISRAKFSVLAALPSTELVILDEWGYLPMDREDAQLLFQVIAASYERRSLVLTTNLEFSKWARSLPMTRWLPR